jgi:hypothetical protein
MFIIIALVLAVLFIVGLIASAPAPTPRVKVSVTVSIGSHRWTESNTDVKFDSEFVVLTADEAEAELGEELFWELLTTENLITASHQYRLANEGNTLLYTKSVR